MKPYKFLLIAICVCLLTSCKKYLDEMPDPTLAIPNTAADLQSLLDSYNTMNERFPTATVLMSDDYYVTDNSFNSVTNESIRKLYYWQADDTIIGGWATVYTGPIINANVVLDNIATILAKGGNKSDLDVIQASALFYRAFYYYAAAQLYAPPYKKETAGTDLGLPLRLSSDFNEPSVRATVENTYAQIINDLVQSAALLPEKQTVKTRPTKAAAYGTLARVYLSMADYEQAGKYAGLCIKSYGADNLIDYNMLNSASAAPFSRFNNEVIFHSIGQFNQMLLNSRAKIDPELYSSYLDDDLRKTLFYKSNNDGTYQFKGDYDGMGTNTGYAFGGIVLDEMYLISAEAYARQNKLELALTDMNKLLMKRFATGKFNPLGATSQKETIAAILKERRKELVFRGTRWTDLRRLKDEPDFSVTPTRTIAGKVYSLTPKSQRYTLLIPATVINLSGMQQNP